MNGFLRQSTASQSRLIGPFIDDVDFITPATGLTIANTDIKLRANGTTLSNKNSGGGTHQVNGQYSVTWDATDTANVGELAFSVLVADAMIVWGFYTVLEEAVYDAMFAASAPGYVANAPVNVAQFGGSNGTFASGRPEVNASHIGGTAQSTGDVSALVTTVDTVVDSINSRLPSDPADASVVAGQITAAADDVLAAIEAFAPGWARKAGAVVDDVGNTSLKFKTDLSETIQNHWKDCLIVFTTGNLTGQIKKITAYSGVTKALTTTGFTEEPADGDEFLIVNV